MHPKKSVRFVKTFVFATGADGGDGGGSGGGSGGGAGGGSGGGADGGKGGGTNDGKKFTQDEVNAFLAKEKRALVAELEKVRSTANLTQQERDDLAKRIETLQAEFMTKEERAQQEYKTRVDTLSAENKSLVAERDSWKSNYANSRFDSETVAAASAKGAFNPAVVADLLRPKMELVAVLDAGGKPTGQYAPKVKIDKVVDGKPTTMLMTPAEAVEHMSGQTEAYGYMFKADKKGGAGGGNSGQQPGAPTGSTGIDYDLAKNNPAAFREALRKQHTK